ncbi:hypothetical protein [Ruegeria sp. Alg231-54]|uniref:hypothetical protein n=1 Tax=Ruegeria sp. Alg231-54 TaxID=1922221 RepID=UPI000D55B21F|nr:hypothetical protein [Ruegeria sp. Alg231-54]
MHVAVSTQVRICVCSDKNGQKQEGERPKRRGDPAGEVLGGFENPLGNECPEPAAQENGKKGACKNAMMPTPRAATPSITTSGGRMTNGNMPTQSGHFDSLSFLRKFINMRLFCKLEASFVILDEARQC